MGPNKIEWYNHEVLVYLKLYADHFSKRKAYFSLGEALKVYESKNLKVAGTSKKCLL